MAATLLFVFFYPVGCGCPITPVPPLTKRNNTTDELRPWSMASYARRCEAVERPSRGGGCCVQQRKVLGPGGDAGEMLRPMRCGAGTGQWICFNRRGWWWATTMVATVIGCTAQDVGLYGASAYRYVATCTANKWCVFFSPSYNCWGRPTLLGDERQAASRRHKHRTEVDEGDTIIFPATNAAAHSCPLARDPHAPPTPTTRLYARGAAGFQSDRNAQPAHAATQTNSRMHARLTS